ncbi:MAG: ASKHA domain-containing protein [Synergistales bacterium]|nr:ASKHA domain-containing protein [Synergistales bacterium]
MEPRDIRIVFQPSGTTARAREGEILHDVAAGAGVRIARPCGGAGSCGKCRVRVAGAAAPPTETERRLLSASDLRDGIRLACAATVAGEAEVHVIDSASGAGSPILSKLAGGDIQWAPDTSGYGVAFDIGTTTLVAYLLDLDGQRVVDSLSFLNPQCSYGDDVVSRIAHCAEEGGLQQLQRSLVEEMNRRLAELAGRNGLQTEDISGITAAGNTVMKHLLAGISPQSIGVSPYKPSFLTLPPMEAASLGLLCCPGSLVKLIPNVAGYVGGDIVAGVAATGMAESETMRLLIDIGTNNEIVLGNRDGLFCCAAAAGPAFEGARIENGMTAAPGAIERVFCSEGDLMVQTIAGDPPRGLCGSGLVDAMALLLDAGIIDRSGRMTDPERCPDPRLRRRLDRNERGILRFLLTDDAHPVSLTQKDVREVQLALGAIRVGAEVLLERAGLPAEEVDEVLLAGAFGNYIDRTSALRIGLLPAVPAARITSVHNTAGLGAAMALASKHFYGKTYSIAEKMEYIELSTLDDFQERFVGAMTF